MEEAGGVNRGGVQGIMGREGVKDAPGAGRNQASSDPEEDPEGMVEGVRIEGGLRGGAAGVEMVEKVEETSEDAGASPPEPDEPESSRGSETCEN